ncbi:MAG: NTPase [Candidatus Bipolaricaulota bacterium]
MTIKGRVALTGRPGVGKTTLIERVLAELDGRIGGFLTRETRKCGHRIGFSLLDLSAGTETLVARVQASGAPRVGRYVVDVAAIDRVGVGAVLRALANADLIVIDEVAPMELLAPRFVYAVEQALASDKGLLIATHANATHPVADRVRQELHLVRVRLGNRDALVEQVRSLLHGETSVSLPPNP